MALRELRIGNVAVVAEATLRCDRGFTALSGETGAGKSVCVSALRAVLGGTLDDEKIRQGADAASLAAVFDEVPDTVRSRLEGLGIPGDELLTLSRTVPRDARGSCRINGSLVSLSTLREVGEHLVEVTSQGASQRLLRRRVQRDILDAAAGESARLGRNAVASAVRALSEALQRLEDTRRALSAGEAALRVARETIAELAPLQLREDEEQELSAELRRLRSAAAISAAASQLADACGADDSGAGDTLARATGAVRDLAAIDSAMRELALAAVDLTERLRDLQLEARRCAQAVVVDEERLGLVEERLEALVRAKRRYGSPAEALEALAEAERLVATAETGGGGLAACEQAVEEARRRAGAAAEGLSRTRSEASRALERAVTDQLRRLALPHARFRVVLSTAPASDGVDVGGERLRCGPCGVDDVEFRLAANRDALPVPLDEGPSGGELSRLALAIAAVVSATEAPALVLDEVDTGIGGETAAVVGDVLARIGAHRQVLAVTHRAEIAARARSHLLVVKRQQAGGPAALVTEVQGERRLEETARLMSGRTTPAALRRAAELLEEGGAEATLSGRAVGGRRS
jgi:DNA repair protein RecN (Recombination protein N)